MGFAYVLSIPASVLAPVTVVSWPRLLADDQPHLSSLAASACEASASSSKHPGPRMLSWGSPTPSLQSLHIGTDLETLSDALAGAGAYR